MKQTLLGFLFTFLAFSLSAQVEFGVESVDRSFLAEGAYDIETKLSITNTTSSNAEFIWDVETVFATESWDYYICDLNKCYAPGTTGVDASASNTLAANASGEMRFHLQPFETVGSAQYIMRLRDIDGNVIEELTLDFNCSLVDTKEEFIAEMNIFPNPVGDDFKLNNAGGLASHIQIYDVLGRQVKSFNVEGNESFYVGDISEGRYFARIFDESGRSLKVVRLIKKYTKA